jgi:hypothetical protein
MGILNLNTFFRTQCSIQSIRPVSLSEFSGKTLVIDTSIYLYKFKKENALLSNMFLLISIFKKYQIQPIFIFDNKPPPEKQKTIEKRNLMKIEAEIKSKQFMQFSNESKDNHWKKQSIRITAQDISSVKQLMDEYGVLYFDAPEEADPLCAYFVHIQKAWACVTDDMDMLVYGCTRVIRHIGLLKHTAVFYDIPAIMDELKLSIDMFRTILVLAGTDYNDCTISQQKNDIIKETNTLQIVWNWYLEFISIDSNRENNSSSESFMNWLIIMHKITDIQLEILQKTIRFFDMYYIEPDLLSKIENKHMNIPFPMIDTHIHKTENWKGVCKIMESHGFIFVK